MDLSETQTHKCMDSLLALKNQIPHKTCCKTSPFYLPSSCCSKPHSPCSVTSTGKKKTEKGDHQQVFVTKTHSKNHENVSL